MIVVQLEKVTIENMIIDARRIVDGCVYVIATLGFVIATLVFFLDMVFFIHFFFELLTDYNRK